MPREPATLEFFAELTPCGEELAEEVGIQCCRGLEMLHSRNIVYRDIRPQNIFIRRQKDSIRLIIGGYSLCRHLDENPHTMEAVITRGYAAPELRDRSACGPFSDVFSLGMTLYWMVNGYQVPEKDYNGLINGQELPRPEKVSDAFWQIIRRATQNDYTARYQTAAELRVALEQARG